MFDPDDLDAIRAGKREWEAETLSATLDRFGERRETFSTDTGGQTVRRLYTPADVADLDYEADLGFPGEAPYTRGVYSTMHRGRLWTMRQYAGMGTAAETNERFRYLIDQGSSGLSLAFDLPTQKGYDSDASMAAGEVGKAGVAVDTLRDMEVVFDGIPLDEVSTSMTINAPAAVLLAMYVAIGDRQGVPREELRGTVQNDILKEYVARNLYIYPPAASMRLITDVFEFCAAETPTFNSISISGYHIREAGSTAAQEIAFTLGNGIEYVEAALEAGLDVDEYAPRLSFFFNAHNNVFEEAAKFRAARRMWAEIMDERFGADDPKSKQLKFHAQTGGSTLMDKKSDARGDSDAPDAPDPAGESRDDRPTGPAPKSLGAFVAGFKSAATTRINAHRGTAGAPVWQRNYHDRIIRTERHWRAARRYIRRNPAKWHNDRFRGDG